MGYVIKGQQVQRQKANNEGSVTRYKVLSTANFYYYPILAQIFKALFNILNEEFVDQHISIHPPQEVQVGPVDEVHLMFHPRQNIW